MQSQRPAEPHRHSAFAAAFFSFIFPGLGQAYLGRWPRALAWAALPVLLLALGAGLLVNPATRIWAEGSMLSPTALTGALALLLLDLVYRLACLLDAYRLGRAPRSATGPTVSAAGRGIASAVGLVAVLAVLVVSHVAVARPVLALRDTFVDIATGTAGDADATTDLAALASLLVPTQPPTSLEPGASIEVTPEPADVAPQGPGWAEGGDRLNILLIGADAGRAGYTTYLTDTMIVVTIDTATRQTAFITMPRDTQNLVIPRDWPLYDELGGLWRQKANTIWALTTAFYRDKVPGDPKFTGFTALKGILGATIGLKIDYFVAVDLKSFREVINDLGGVMIDVQNPVQDDHYPADDGDGHIKLYIEPGLQFMQGQRALAYARARHLTSDFDRSLRQQRVIASVRQQLDLPSLLTPGKIGELLATFRSSVRTDFPFDKLPQLIGLAQDLDLDKRLTLALNPPVYSRTCYPCPPDGQYVLEANVGRMRRDVAEIFRRDAAASERADQLQSEGAVVDVLNGTSSNNLKTTRIADHLASLGVTAVVPPVNGGAADRDDYTATVITVYNGASDQLPITIATLEQELGVTAVTANDAAQSADIVVVVGSDTPILRP